MKKRTAVPLWLLLAPLLALLSSTAAAQASEFDDLQMNGMAAFEQLRKEYYIGALYLESMSTDAATVVSMPGRKRMSIRITADRWPPLRFAQQWNQTILINNSSQTLNANVMDVLAFTSLPKDDLVAGDRLTIDLLPDVGTRVTLNGTPMLQTRSDVLFQLLVNTWIGARPSTSDFKRDMLKLSTDGAATELLTRYESLAPDAARSKLVAGWAGKVEAGAAVEATATAQRPGPAENTQVVGRSNTTATAVAASGAALTTGAAIAAPVVNAPVIAGPTTVAAASTPKPQAAEPAAVATPKPVANPAPVASAKPVAVAAPVTAAVTAPPTVAAAAPQPQTAAAQVDTTSVLYNSYSNNLRRIIYAKLSYPRRAVQKEIEGLVVLRVNSDRNGKLISAEVAQSAHTMLDNAATEAATKAAPFPAMATEMTGDNFVFMIPVVFKLAD